MQHAAGASCRGLTLPSFDKSGTLTHLSWTPLVRKNGLPAARKGAERAWTCPGAPVQVFEKSIEKEKESLSRHFDSLIKQSINYQLEWQKNQSSVTDNLKLSSISELDSLGNRKPFHYKHYVDGFPVDKSIMAN